MKKLMLALITCALVYYFSPTMVACSAEITVSQDTFVAVRGHKPPPRYDHRHHKKPKHFKHPPRYHKGHPRPIHRHPLPRHR